MPSRKSPIKKLYCFVDETGQDTNGEWFLVSVVVIGGQKDQLEQQLFEIEHESRKHLTKWHRSKHGHRLAYIEGVLKLNGLKNALYYSVYKDTKLFADLVVLTTAKAIFQVTKDNYRALIVVDGLSRNLERQFAASLRKLCITTEKVKGGREESSPLLRLADALAGLLRDAYGRAEWAREKVQQLNKKSFIHEI